MAFDFTSMIPKNGGAVPTDAVDVTKVAGSLQEQEDQQFLGFLQEALMGAKGTEAVGQKLQAAGTEQDPVTQAMLAGTGTKTPEGLDGTRS
jgi:hypothetical protein